MPVLGAVAAGHPATAKAAAEILREGGNAFDAIIAAQFAACVCETVFTSLAGGGFLLARDTRNPQPVLYDFFTQTPGHMQPEGERDFRPIHADFGTATQEFHIGMAAVATPGMIKGLYRVHAQHASLPMPRLLETAIRHAREGIDVEPMQAFGFQIVQPIYTSTHAALEQFGSPAEPTRLASAGETLHQPKLADFLQQLARDGEDCFYRGEIAHEIDALSRHHGGHLRLADLERYQVIQRAPLALDFDGHRLLTNPPPSSGGMLIAFALQLLQAHPLRDVRFADRDHLHRLIEIMATTNQARAQSSTGDSHHPAAERLFEPSALNAWRDALRQRLQCNRGTTHISVMDAQGNAAGLTSSNGEGCGYLIPDTGIMLNNMLGEDDLNPHGFHRWPTDSRMTSMMAPSLLTLANGDEVILGSGGSNRLRTAILQVLINLCEFGMPLQAAVDAPRVHLEDGCLHAENELPAGILTDLPLHEARLHQWPERNLYFGGTHCAARIDQTFAAAADARRGGYALVVE